MSLRGPTLSYGSEGLSSPFLTPCGTPVPQHSNHAGVSSPATQRPTFVYDSHSQPMHQDPSLSIFIKSKLLEALASTTGPTSSLACPGPRPCPRRCVGAFFLPSGSLEMSLAPRAHSTMSSRPWDSWGSPLLGAMSSATSLTLQGKCASTLVHISYRIGIRFNLCGTHSCRASCWPRGNLLQALESHTTGFQASPSLLHQECDAGQENHQVARYTPNPVTSEAAVGRCHCFLQFCSVYPVPAQPLLHNETKKCASVSSVQNGDNNGTCFLQPMIRTWHAVGRDDSSDSPTRLRTLLRNWAQ